MEPFPTMLERFFNLRQSGTDVRTEMLAGLLVDGAAHAAAAGRRGREIGRAHV